MYDPPPFASTAARRTKQFKATAEAGPNELTHNCHHVTFPMNRRNVPKR
jgi:hypothetical protein